MTTDSLFEYATKHKLRFSSVKGELSVESLWDVPLRSKDNFNLNAVAVATDKSLKEVTEKNFVDGADGPEKGKRTKAMELVMYVIDQKKSAEERAEKRAENKKKMERLLEVLAEKQAGRLSELSEKEIQKQLIALRNESED